MSLVGTWVVDGTDTRTLAALGDVLLEFDARGALTYIVRDGDRTQIINLRYQIDGDTIITDQPSSPRVEHTVFSVSGDGVLTLAFGGVPYRFRRWEPGRDSTLAEH